MAKTPEQLDELLKLVRDEDIGTLRALERQLHSLLEEKERDEALRQHGRDRPRRVIKAMAQCAHRSRSSCPCRYPPGKSRPRRQSSYSRNHRAEIDRLKIFIDVNVFIDVMTKRSGWTESLRVLNLARRSQELESWTSALTLPLVYFFRRRVTDEASARADAQAILKGLHLVPMNQAILDHVLASAGPDFEDNIQLASAESISANHLITRNKKDFDTSNITALTPEEWLALQEVAALEAKLT